MDIVTGKAWSYLPLEKKKEDLRTTIQESRDLLEEFEAEINALTEDSKIKNVSLDLITAVDMPKETYDIRGMINMQSCTSGDLENHFYAVCMLAEELSKDYEMNTEEFLDFMRQRINFCEHMRNKKNLL